MERRFQGVGGSRPHPPEKSVQGREGKPVSPKVTTREKRSGGREREEVIHCPDVEELQQGNKRCLLWSCPRGNMHVHTHAHAHTQTQNTLHWGSPEVEMQPRNRSTKLFRFQTRSKALVAVIFFARRVEAFKEHYLSSHGVGLSANNPQPNGFKG